MTKVIDQVGWIAYGKNRTRFGNLGSDGCIRCSGVTVFRIEGDSIYSMHGQYLGRLQRSVGVTSREELLFVLSRR